MSKKSLPGDAILWNGEEATLLAIDTPQQQREEWQRDPTVVAGWYKSGEDEEPLFETLYEIQDRYGVSHVIIGNKEFDLLQQGSFYCCTCVAIRPISVLSKRRQGECACVTCVEQPATRHARYDWLDDNKEGIEQ
jgi:hypothetical protein